MRSEEDLRAALRLLERETPSRQTVLRRVTERTVGETARPKDEWPTRRLVAAAAAAAAVIAIVAAAALVANRVLGHRPASAPGTVLSPSVSPSVSPSPYRSSQAAPAGLPRYYMAVVPDGPGSNSPDDALVLDSVTGRKLATVRPPRPYVTFTSVTGAADDRTFVLTAQSATASNPGTRIGFYEARFDPADNKLALSRLALPGLTGGTDLAGAELSPDGRQFAVASQIGGFAPAPAGSVAQIAVYSLPGGATRVWRETGSFANTGADLLTWDDTGTLAFSWQSSSLGLWLLNTHDPGGGLLADSRQLLCSAQGFVATPYAGYLTPGGTTVISSVPAAVPRGQRPQCPGGVVPTPSAGSPGVPSSVLEAFSAATGRALGVVPADPSRPVVGNIWWSNASGSALVVNASATAGGTDTFGVLSRGRFTPIPGAPSVGILNPATIAF